MKYGYQTICAIVILAATFIVYYNAAHYHVNYKQVFIRKLPYVFESRCKRNGTPLLPLLVMSERDFNPPENRTHSSKYSNSTDKLIVWLNVPEWEPHGSPFRGCRVSQCSLSLNSSLIEKADAVIAHGVHMPRDDVPRANTDQVWIFYGLESPLHYDNNYRQPYWRGRFNWTATYKLDSDIPNPYGYLMLTEKMSTTKRILEETGKKKMEEEEKKKKEEEKQEVEDILKISRQKTSPIAWFVSNCNTPSQRQKYVAELKKHITVDIYGQCGNKVCSKKRNTNCMRMLNTTYLFYLSFENSLCRDYITEKLLLLYSTDAVPIVRGGADYSNLLPCGTYINTDWFQSPKKLADYLKYLQDNISEYAKYLKAKRRYRYIPSDRSGKLRMYCRLCEKLHEEGVPSRKAYSDISSWLNDGMCHSPRDL